MMWENLGPDLKICVTIHDENEAGRDVWFTKLAEILDDELTRTEISKNEDRLMDLGIIDKQWKIVEGKWTYCYRICKCVESFVNNIAENVERHEMK